jgi:hypothetical protein
VVDTDFCGDGFVGPNEVCEPALTVNNCGRNCLPITSASCFACENEPSTCQDFVDCGQVAGNAAAGTPGAGIPRLNLCNEVLDCVRDSGCAAGGRAPILCYCGTANISDCQNGLANGACKAELERGLESVSFAQITQRLKNPQFGGGLAMVRIDCDQVACNVPCGLQ